MSSVAATSSSTSTYTDNVSSRVAQKILGQSDFLKLLTTQMTNQDPMNPISDTDQIAQLAQFSSLQSMNALLVNSQLQGASSMIGKNVTALSETGKQVNGTVESAQVKSDKVYVTINGQQYPYATISQVKAATETTTKN
ncbi:MAG: flagellar hook capping FlgD N-terminal domain-containing protein [Nibricoccus sp.]